jgi:adenine-specific DNA-methyltransferase
MTQTSQSTDIQALNGESMDLTEHNLEQLKALFPNVFSEGKIDFDALKAELGASIEESNERYQFTWAGKEQAKRIATTPSLGTLRPAPDESVNWDSTENLYIEGDNLEVLKLLQKSYFGKVKMIYIDPPYNTGKDFVYKDDFKDNLANYQRLTGQKDEEGNPLTTNSDSAGRYHSNWLNMMYPRLKLARNLLKDDGVIFISIDDNEVHNLRKICDEVFGESNHIADFVWKNKKGGGNDSKYVAVEHEYIIMYAKNEIHLHNLFEPYKPEYLKRYKEEDKESKFFWDTFKRKSGKQYYPIKCPDGSVLEFDELGNKISWLRSESRFHDDVKKGDIRFVQAESGQWSIHFKQRLPQGKKPRTVYLEDSVFDNYGTTSDGSSRILELFKKDVFSNPKPISLIQHLIGFSVSNDDLILDFFAGSGTLQDAVFNINCEEGGTRKVISVQVPEKIGNKTEIEQNARELGFETISQLSINRLKKSSEAALKANPESQADLGFKVLKLDTSNIKKWQPNLDTLEADLLDAVDNIVDGRTAEDLLYEVLIKYGLPLTLPIEKIQVANHQAYNVAFGSLVACFDENITLDTIQAICNLSTPENPVLRVVFRDTSFDNDITKTNAIQRLKQSGIEDVLSI